MEVYRDVAALRAHGASDHFAHFNESSGEMVEGIDLKMLKLASGAEYFGRAGLGPVGLSKL